MKGKTNQQYLTLMLKYLKHETKMISFPFVQRMLDVFLNLLLIDCLFLNLFNISNLLKCDSR